MSSVDVEDEMKLIRQVLLESVEAEKRGDVEAALNEYHDEIVWLAPNMPILKGIQRIRGFFEELLKSIVLMGEFEITRIEVSRSGDLAYALGTYQGIIYEGPEGHIEDSGKWHRTMKKIDAEWKCVVLSWSSDNPLE